MGQAQVFRAGRESIMFTRKIRLCSASPFFSIKARFLPFFFQPANTNQFSLEKYESSFLTQVSSSSSISEDLVRFKNLSRGQRVSQPGMV